jgi:hypothetical protein
LSKRKQEEEKFTYLKKNAVSTRINKELREVKCERRKKREGKKGKEEKGWWD